MAPQPAQPIAPAFTKGQSKLIKCMGSVGGIVTSFDTKEVLTGSYRHTQTIDGVSYSWKCALPVLTGTVKIVYDTFQSAEGERGFWRMEALVDNMAVVASVDSVFKALTEMEF